MKIEDIHPRMILQTDVDGGDFVLVSQVSINNNVFSGFSLKTYWYEEDFLPHLFYESTFYEAFRNEINKITLDAITEQHKKSLWDAEHKKALAVSDSQKEWILEHYEPKQVDKQDISKKEQIKSLTKSLIEARDYGQKMEKENYELSDENGYLLFKNTEYKEQIKSLIEENEKLESKISEQQREFDERFAEIYDKYTAKKNEVLILSNELSAALKFITHLQNYISAKFLQSENLIFKSKQEEK